MLQRHLFFIFFEKAKRKRGAREVGGEGRGQEGQEGQEGKGAGGQEGQQGKRVLGLSLSAKPKTSQKRALGAQLFFSEVSVGIFYVSFATF